MWENMKDAFAFYSILICVPKTEEASLSGTTQRRLCLHARDYTPTKFVCQPLFDHFFKFFLIHQNGCKKVRIRLDKAGIWQYNNGK